jgi:inorganic pyrophosphatase
MKMYKSHPWHGISCGNEAPAIVTAFIEIVPTDTIKYEIDKESGWLKVDRPQLYSNHVPALYGFVPQTYCGRGIASLANENFKGKNVRIGDGDPLDILVLTENTITHGGILLKAKPIGGFCLVDNGEADDKIIAVLQNDAEYGNVHSIFDLKEKIIARLKHYFLTYKNMPFEKPTCEISDIYGPEMAQKVINTAMQDYTSEIKTA